MKIKNNKIKNTSSVSNGRFKNEVFLYYLKNYIKKDKYFKLKLFFMEIK